MDIYRQRYHGIPSVAPGGYQSSYKQSSSKSSYSTASRSSYQPTSGSPTSGYISRYQAAPVKSTYYPGSYCKRRASSSRYQSPSRRYESPAHSNPSPSRSYQSPARSNPSPARGNPSPSRGYQTPARSQVSAGGVHVVITHGQGGEPVPVMASAYREPEVSRRLAYDIYPEDNVYLEKMQDILSAYPCVGVPPEPSPIMGTVFLGTTSNAENFRLLKKNKISYILNCGGGNPVEFRRLRDLYAPEDTGIMGYEELPLEDRESCRIKDSFARAHKFIDFGRSRNGRVLICCPGVSRSGAIAMSYMIANGSTLLEAVRQVKHHRRVALCNVGFMKQLVSYARARGALDSGVTVKKGEKSECSRGLSSLSYSNRFDRYRIYSASMPRIIGKAY